MKLTRLEHRFVDEIPGKLVEGVLYVSMINEVAVHLCPSGCGLDVVTPLGRGGWTLYFDGTVTLRPSVGNFDYECESHYVITRGQVLWLERWQTRWPTLDASRYQSEPRPGWLERFGRSLRRD